MDQNNEKSFTLSNLYEKILLRKLALDSNSYTSKLFNDEILLKKKIVEEAAEVILASGKEKIVWEVADLIYFLFVKMAKEGITIKDLEEELERKNLAKESGKKVGGGGIS